MSHELRKVKFLHIFWHADIKFNPKFVRMINEEKSLFNADDHLFITPHKRVYDEISQYGNTVLVGNASENLINRFGEYGKWIIVHSMNCTKLQLIATKSKYLKKVVWRTWGHDIRPEASGKNFLKHLFNIIYRKKVRKIKAFGIGGDMDKINIEKVFGKMPMFMIGYNYDPDRENNLKRILSEIKPKKDREPIRILVGHSGSPTDRHITALEKIKRFADENITVCLILSYGGSPEYMNEVRKRAYDIFGAKVEIIDRFMEYAEYAKYLSTMDIVLFNQKYSAALGNINILLYFGKTLYVASDGQMAESFSLAGCDCNTIDKIDDMSYNEFIRAECDDKLREKFGHIVSNESLCKSMQKVFEWLEG